MPGVTVPVDVTVAACPETKPMVPMKTDNINISVMLDERKIMLKRFASILRIEDMFCHFVAFVVFLMCFC